MTNIKETLRNEYPSFMEMVERTIADNNYLSEKVDRQDEVIMELEEALAEARANIRALKGQLAALVVDKEIGEVLPS